MTDEEAAAADETTSLAAALADVETFRAEASRFEHRYVRECEETLRLRKQVDAQVETLRVLREEAAEMTRRLRDGEDVRRSLSGTLQRALGFIEALQGARMPGGDTSLAGGSHINFADDNFRARRRRGPSFDWPDEQ